MYNWRLLLLAVFAVFQPIASFTDRNLVDGRQQCCDHRLERDPAYSLYGKSGLKPPSEDYRVTGQNREIREVRRNENAVLSRYAINSKRDLNENKNRRSIDLNSRSSRSQSQREREVRNGIVSEGRQRISRESLRNTRSDRVRVLANRDILYRETRVNDINRETRSMITRDGTENGNQANERRDVSSQREARDLQTDIYRNRGHRESWIEMRRTSNNHVQSESLLRSNSRDVRREHDFRASSNIDDRAYETDELRNIVRNDLAYRSTRVVKQRNDYQRHSTDTRKQIKERSVSPNRKSSNIRNIPLQARDNNKLDGLRGREITAQRLSESRITKEIRNNQADSRRSHIKNDMTQLRHDENTELREQSVRLTSEQRLARENQRRMETTRDTKDEKRIIERAASEIVRDQRITRENERTETRIEGRTINERNNRERAVRLSSRMGDRENSQNERNGIRDAGRTRESRDIISIRRIESRTRKDERQIGQRVVSEYNRLSRMNGHKMTHEQRNLRNNERRETRDADRIRDSRDNISERRSNSQTRINERQVRERVHSESDRLSSRMITREITRERRDVRDNERKETRDSDRIRESRENISERRSDSQSRINERQIRERVLSESDRLSLRMNNREFTRERRDLRDNESRETRNADRIRESRDNISERRSGSQSRINERQIRGRVLPESDRLFSRMNNREIICERRDLRDNERRETRDSDRIRESRDNISERRTNSQTRINERQVRERVLSESDRLSSRMNNREIIRERRNLRDNERRETRDSDRIRVTRDNISERRSESQSRINERQVRERVLSGSNRLSSRTNDRELARSRHDVRDNERWETRNADRTSELTKENVSMKRTESRAINERRVRERATSENSRLGARMNDRETVHVRRSERDNERMETRNADRIRELSGDNISMRRTESRTTTNERLVRERATLAIRISSRTDDQEIYRNRFNVRDNEKRETRNADLRRTERRTRTDMNVARREIDTLSQKNRENGTQATEYSWQYLIYTLQVIYLCSVFMPTMTAKNQNDKKLKHMGWWTPFQSVIKAD